MTLGSGPKDIGRIADEAIALYRRNLRAVLTASAIVLFPVGLAATVAQVFYIRGLTALPGMLRLGGDADLAGLGRLQGLYALSLVVALMLVVARKYFESAVYGSASALLADARPGPREFLRAGRPRFVALVLVSFVVYVLASMPAALFFLIVPLAASVYIALGLAVAGPMTVIEGASLGDAIGRSWALTAGMRRRVAAFWLGLGALSAAFEGAITSPAALRQIVDIAQRPDALFRELSVGWQVLEGLLAAASVALVVPFGYFAWLLFYLDLRSRREGMDLLARANALTAEA